MKKILFLIGILAISNVMGGDPIQIMAQGKTMSDASAAANHIAFRTGASYSGRQIFRNIDGSYSAILTQKAPKSTNPTNQIIIIK